MLPLCLDRHVTPSHENGDRAPFNPPSARQHPLTPATAPRSPAVPCSEYTLAHETKQEKKVKKGSRWQVTERGGVQVGALRGQGCANRARSERNAPASRFITSMKKSKQQYEPETSGWSSGPVAGFDGVI